MNPQDDMITPVPENDFLGAARAIETGQMTDENPISEAVSTEETDLSLYETGQESSLSLLGSSARNIVSEYPGPALLIGAGLAWMLICREQKYSRPLPARIKDSALHGKDQLMEKVQHAKEQIHDAQVSLAERAREAREEAIHGYERSKMKASLKAETSKLQARQRLDEAKASAEARAEAARESYQHVLEDNPLILGACAMVAGLAIGLLIPSTQREDEMMGAQRDSLLDQARTIVDNARQAAVSTLRSGTENVKAHLSEATETAKETLNESLQNAKNAAKSEGTDPNPSTDLVP